MCNLFDMDGFSTDRFSEEASALLENPREGDLEKLKNIFDKYSRNTMWWDIIPVYDWYYSEIEYKLRKNKK